MFVLAVQSNQVFINIMDSYSKLLQCCSMFFKNLSHGPSF